MVDFVQANPIPVVAALLVLLLAIWWIAVSRRRTTITRDETPEDTGPAKRNQALMDAPSASTAPPQERAPVTPTPATEILAGAGIPAAAGAQQEVGAAGEKAAATPAPGDNAAGIDDLTRIKGVGPKLATMLQDMGITSFAQIAGWDDAEIDRVDAQLGRFEGRIRRDDWPAQASLLAAGDMSAYEARFGRL